jgi:hypothetical protein
MVEEPTEMVPGVDAGVLLQADVPSFPAAAITTIPLFIKAVMALSTDVTWLSKPILRFKMALSPTT